MERPNNQNKYNKSFHRKVERLNNNNNQNKYNRTFHRKVERPNNMEKTGVVVLFTLIG